MIQTNTLSQFKLSSMIIDKKNLDVEKLFDYNLFFELSDRYLKIVVQDAVTGNCLLFENYTFVSKFNELQLIAQLEIIFAEHTLLDAGYWKSIQLSFSHNIFSFVPSEFYDADFKEEYLSINTKIPENSVLMAQELSTEGINIVFAAKKSALENPVSIECFGSSKVVQFCSLNGAVVSEKQKNREKQDFERGGKTEFHDFLQAKGIAILHNRLQKLLQFCYRRAIVGKRSCEFEGVTVLEAQDSVLQLDSVRLRYSAVLAASRFFQTKRQVAPNEKAKLNRLFSDVLVDPIELLTEAASAADPIDKLRKRLSEIKAKKIQLLDHFERSIEVSITLAGLLDREEISAWRYLLNRLYSTTPVASMQSP